MTLGGRMSTFERKAMSDLFLSNSINVDIRPPKVIQSGLVLATAIYYTIGHSARYVMNAISGPKWDLVVLTARNAEQRELFELQLATLRLEQRKFCAQIMVLEDTPANAKIGSGGATLNALLFLYKHFGGDPFFASNRVLLLHSGGLSQRIFHVALTGKAFMLMPDGLTLLEHKLLSYRPLLRSLDLNGLPGFVFVASADVLEHFPAHLSLSWAQSNVDILLICHQSSMDIAEQHGVYLLSERLAEEDNPEGPSKWPTRLKRVLQKPTREEIRTIGAVLPPNKDWLGPDDELVLTDSCYMLSSGMALELVGLRQKMSDMPLAEICCYRDFLCPLGYASEEERKAHFRADEPALLSWQTAIWNFMNFREVQVVDLGSHSFFHFGTPNELLAHFFGAKSAFRDKFLPDNPQGNALYSVVGQETKISSKSLVEWSRLDGNCEVSDGCILSGLVYDGQESMRIGDGVCACTFPIEHGVADQMGAPGVPTSFVTVAFHRLDDLKLCSAHSLRWFGHSLQVPPGSNGSSLWDLALFSVHPTPAESLRATLATIVDPKQNDAKNGKELWSISRVLAKVRTKTLLEWRKGLIGRR